MAPASIAQGLRAARQRLSSTSDSPDLDARLLLMHALDVDAGYLIVHAQDTLSDAPYALFARLLERRASGEPIAYIVGHIGFWSLELTITRDVLVPRPDTETLVEVALATLGDTPLAVADLGTGSGAIALALASERPHWHITATDASADALACAQANAQALGLTQVVFEQGDWCAPLRSRRLDAIVSNPPYIAAGDPHLSAAALGFEPTAALVAGDAGLADIARLIRDARQNLAADGWLMLEHGAAQASEARQLFREAGYRDIRTHPDLAGRERVTAGQRGR